jgi:hypothetical protein
MKASMKKPKQKKASVALWEKINETITENELMKEHPDNYGSGSYHL